ncbi:MAG TPA: protein kinase [Blastocatellia bacterium]|nr:protein kinase [Blastocatellia bacterium]
MSCPAPAPQPRRSPRKIRARERFQLVEEIGKGGMGTVYRALDRELNRTVAVKVLRPEAVPNLQNLLRLKRELVLASRVCHENVVRFYDIGEIDGRALISMDWVDGENLAQFLNRVHRLPPSQVSGFALQIAQALRAIHAANIVHQDLKPGNLLIRRDGTILITDFGLARSAMSDDARISRPGDIVGTRAYMAPEQLAGLPADARSDLYSLGMVLLEMLTATTALEALAPLRLQWLASEEGRRRAWVELLYLSALDLVIRGCLQPDRTARYSSADEILEILKLADTEAKALAAPRAPADGRSVAGFRKWKWSLLVALLLTMLVGYAAYFRGRAARAARSQALYAQALALVNDQSDAGELKRALNNLDQIDREVSGTVGAFRMRVDTLIRLYEQAQETQWLDRARHELESPAAVRLSHSERARFQARVDLHSGSFEKVVGALRGDAALLASSEEANRLLGRALAASQQNDSAVESFRSAIRLDHESWRAHNDLGAALFTIGKLGGAREEFHRVIELRPDAPTGYQNLGSVQLALGNFLAARRSFESALERSPSATSYYNLGVTAFFLREYASSIPFFETAGQIRPTSDLYITGLADSLRKLHRSELARKNYSRALALLNDLRRTRRLTTAEQCRRAIDLARLGDRIAAASILEEFPADIKSKDVAYAQAIVAMLEGRTAAANHHLKDAVRLGYPKMLIELSPEFDDLPP